jgi:nitrite reductase/ring-hydroxylating ferredoxin subunit
VLCPLHGWPIDAAAGGCAAGTFCRYERLAVESDDAEIR